jgi:pyruvate formate lyase activating enzyme
MKTAAYFSIPDSSHVRCELCPHHCILADGKRGLCLTRQNLDNRLVSLNYCRPVSTNIDPIEKKPLYHFFPRTEIFSTGPNGCNLTCSFCQNNEISQEILRTTEVPARTMVDAVVNSGSIGIAYTYSEPYIWFETIMEVGAKIREHGLKNVMVTNGYMEPAPLADLLTIVDAMNIDIKSMRQEFYRRLCKADLAPVLKTCETVKKHCHLEITNLIIPNENDSDEELRDLVNFIADTLGKDTPLHFSRYFPRHQMRTAATTADTLMRAWNIAKERLEYVYVGNIDAKEKANTYCPKCNELLIERRGYNIKKNKNLIVSENSNFGRCKTCGHITNIILD